MSKYLSICIAVLFALILAAPESSATVFRHDVLSVRIEGYVGTKPADVPLQVSWIVSVKGELYDLHVSKMVVLTGNVAYYDIITALQPYRPALTVIGDDEQIDLFATAPANQEIMVTGFFQFAGGARYLMLSSVDYVGEVEQTPPPTDATESAPDVFP
jgi:hypothetical protein